MQARRVPDLQQQQDMLQHQPALPHTRMQPSAEPQRKDAGQPMEACLPIPSLSIPAMMPASYTLPSISLPKPSRGHTLNTGPGSPHRHPQITFPVAQLSHNRQAAAEPAPAQQLDREMVLRREPARPAAELGPASFIHRPVALPASPRGAPRGGGVTSPRSSSFTAFYPQHASAADDLTLGKRLIGMEGGLPLFAPEPEELQEQLAAPNHEDVQQAQQRQQQQQQQQHQDLPRANGHVHAADGEHAARQLGVCSLCSVVRG